jgi:hypothetical protein
MLDAGSMAPGCVVRAVGDLGPLAMRAGDSRDSAGWRRAQKRVQVRRRVTDAPAGRGRRGARVAQRARDLACLSKRL